MEGTKQVELTDAAVMPVQDEWKKYNPTDGYEKTMYDIKLFNGDIITHCWPNGGVWNIARKAGNEKYYDEPPMPVDSAEYVRFNINL